jgi:UDP-N-acetylglucosamine--N-acetylmuramyl-(pentapeptide) pyrophosphoryl-undecaprenol N-acetylglucosamine transferase
MKALRIIFAGGGTGGHVFPALAIAEEIRKIEPDAEVFFIGTKNKIEARVVPGRGYPFRSIWISGWSRRLNPASVLFPIKLMVAMIQSYTLIREIKPDVVVGTGGYVCGPVVRAARLLRIPTVIQEQNSYPGATTRMLARHADRVHITFDETRKYLRRLDNVEMSGNPTRSELDGVSRGAAMKKFGFDPKRPVMLVFGGSQGAVTINNAVLASLPVLERFGGQLLWITGDSMYDGIRKRTAGREGCIVVRFMDDMASAYAAASFALCRAGATTIAELTRTGVPSILVPYPYAAANHQEVNARTLTARGAARMIKDANLGGQLAFVLEEFLTHPASLDTMREEAKKLGKPDAGKVIAESIIKLAAREKR